MAHVTPGWRAGNDCKMGRGRGGGWGQRRREGSEDELSPSPLRGQESNRTLTARWVEVLETIQSRIRPSPTAVERHALAWVRGRVWSLFQAATAVPSTFLPSEVEAGCRLTLAVLSCHRECGVASLRVARWSIMIIGWHDVDARVRAASSR
eukprot:3656311-Rhodomonas_salina.1